MIRASSLTKYYESRCAVRDLSFRIEDHEIVGFLGLNGAGKTTALRMLAGLLQPSSGRVELNGRDLLNDPLAFRWQIGFLPERPPLYEEMVVRKYLAFAARLRAYPEDRVDRRVTEVIQQTALGEYADELIGNLSHGYKQRLGIAQAIVHEPALVILDEPINGLDPVQIVEMRTLIRGLKDQHTVLISSHILPEISQTCDRLLVLHHGVIIHEGPEQALAERLAASGAQLIVEVKGSEAQLRSALEDPSVVEKLELVAQGEGWVRARVSLAKKDTSEEVAKKIVGAGLGLRRLEPERDELEAMFMTLTKS